MKHQLRSRICTEGRRMAGARALWVATGMKREQFGKPIIAIVNSFTQFVPGHTHLHEIGQIVKQEIEAMGCYAAEFNTIAIDDGIAMGHDGMLYSLPSRDIIADSVEYMVNAHKADAMICISNCDKVTPGMLMASMRLNIPTVFCSGGPMEAGKWRGENADLITAMIKGADPSVSDEEMAQIEGCACPGCGSCSGMFTANSMNSLTEAIGLSLPGNGTILATHANRIELFKAAARQVVKNALAYYEDGDESVLPRNIATRDAFLNAMTLDIAMGGSTNTVLHLLAVAQEAGADFTIKDIDELSRKTPCLCKLAPNTQKYSVQECNRAGGILGIMNELNKGGLIRTNAPRVDGMTLGEAMKAYDITSETSKTSIYFSAPGNRFSTKMGSQSEVYPSLDTDRANGCIRDIAHALSLMTRANGHFPEFYSVGQHCIHCYEEAVARKYSPFLCKACLLHDASEAYLADITRPVKQFLPGYLEIEKRLQDTIYEKFLGRVPTETEQTAISSVDDTLLYYEFDHYMGEKLQKKPPKLYSAPIFEQKTFSEIEEKYILFSQS